MSSLMLVQMSQFNTFLTKYNSRVAAFVSHKFHLFCNLLLRIAAFASYEFHLFRNICYLG